MIPVSFKSDGFNLSGTLHLPENRLPPIVIGCHGLLSSSESPKQVGLANLCNAAGIAYFRFDHRGCGKSDGALETDTSFESRCRDLRHALQTMKSMDFIGDGVGLFGSSLGGAVSLEIAATNAIQAVVTFAAPYHSLMLSKKASRPRLSFDLSSRLSSIRNIYIFHGESDATVPVAHARYIFENTGEPKKLTLQKNGDHRMSNKTHQNDFMIETVRWFGIHLLRG